MKKRIVYVQYTNPAAYPPLEHSSRLLAARGWEVLFLGTEGNEVRSLRFPEHPRIRVELASFCPPGWRQKLHYARFAARALARIIAERPDWVYASDLWSCPIGLLASQLGFRVLYHEHDYVDPAAGGTPSAATRLVQSTRLQLARRAQLCVLPNERRAAEFARATGAPAVATVWNCPRLEEVAPPRTHPVDTVRLIYYGSIVPKRLPLAIADALALLPANVRLRVVGYVTLGHQTHAEDFRRRAAELGIADRIEIIGPFSRAVVLEHCRASDIGLATLPRHGDENESTMVGSSNKAFDYLACGVPLIVPDLPEWRATFVDAGYGHACEPEDARSVADALRPLVLDPQRARRMGESGRQRILAEWNYDRQFEPVLRHLEGAAASAPPAARPARAIA